MNEKYQYWENIFKLRQAKRITPAHKINLKLINLSKSKVGVLIGYYSGYCQLGYYLKKLDKANKKICHFCNGVKETLENTLCHCQALTRQRIAKLGKTYICPLEVSDANPI